jgi:hypothetical protein
VKTMKESNVGTATKDRIRLSARLLVALSISVVMVTGFAIWQLPQASALGDRPYTVFGPEKTMGAGAARSYLSVENGLPVEIGFELTENALHDLPAAPHHPGHHVMTEYILELPKEAQVTPFKFLELDWNPYGHEPDGIYNRPHFDFHFYTIAKEQRDAIDPADPDYMRKAENLPPAAEVPADYITPPPITPVPRMGVHWVSTNAEELNGKPFRQTFIRGSWNGRMIFYEPMITKAFLESRPDVTFPIAPANRYEPSGYHPTTYTVRYDSAQQVYRVSLGGFEYRSDDVLDTTLRPSHRAEQP